MKCSIKGCSSKGIKTDVNRIKRLKFNSNVSGSFYIINKIIEAGNYLCKRHLKIYKVCK